MFLVVGIWGWVRKKGRMLERIPMKEGVCLFYEDLYVYREWRKRGKTFPCQWSAAGEMELTKWKGSKDHLPVSLASMVSGFSESWQVK